MCRAHERMLPESGGPSATVWLCLLLVRAPRWCSLAGSNGMRDWGRSRGTGAGAEGAGHQGALPVDGAGAQRQLPAASVLFRSEAPVFGAPVEPGRGFPARHQLLLVVPNRSERRIFISIISTKKPAGWTWGRALAWHTFGFSPQHLERKSFFPR